MNLPNKLTVSRFVLTAVFLVVMFSRVRFHETISLAVFVAASLTDYFDGKIARDRKLITSFGILMDPLADKILVCSAFIAFVDRDWFPAWMAVIVVARELAITGLRRYGKHKTASQIVAIISVLVLHSYQEWGLAGQTLFGSQIFGTPWIGLLAQASKWAAVLLTGYSGCVYLWRNREIYLSDM
jgi:CDP-diacylglycerol--glycerol-3-phosphate 3-phosphatidyltransferase